MTTTSPLTPAPVPALDPALLAARRGHLVREISARPSRTNPRRRWTLTAAAATVVAAAVTAVVALITGVAGPAAAPAIAGWTAEPTGVPVGQQTAVRASCLAAMPTSGTPKAAASGPWRLVLAEQRGPTRFSILVSGTHRVACLDLAGVGVSITNWATVGTGEPAANAATVDRISRAQRAGTGFTFVEGTVGASVTSLRLRLPDGQLVTASIAAPGATTPRAFAAWWPNGQQPTSLLVTTAQGSTTQAAPSPGPTRSS